MDLIQAIREITAAIDESARTESDGPWKSAVTAAGLVSLGDTSQMGIDELFERSYGSLVLRFQHKWWDTSKTFSPGPDRTRLTLTLLQGTQQASTYSASYDT